MTPVELVPPQGPSQRGPSGHGLCSDKPRPTSAILQQEGTRAGPSIISSRILLQLAQITAQQMGQVSACILQLGVREEYSD